MKNKFLGLLLMTIICLLPGSVQAGTIESGDSYILPAHITLNDNLYAAGGLVQVSGAVSQDAMLAGGTVAVTGSVEKDLTIAGGTVTVTGNTGDDLRVVGGNVQLLGNVGGEVIAVGGSIIVSENVEIAKSAYVSGGKVIIAGNIIGDLEVYAEDVEILGIISGNITGKVNNLKLLPGATVFGDLRYESPQEAYVDINATVFGRIDYNKAQIKPIVTPDKEVAVRMMGSLLAGYLLIKYLAVLLTAFLLVYLLNRQSEKLVNLITVRFWKNFLVGLLIFIILPMVGLLLFVSGFGSLIAVIGGLLFSILYTLAIVFAGVLLGSWIIKMWSKGKKFIINWKSILLGVTLMSILALIPIIGWLVRCILIMATFGTFCIIVYNYIRLNICSKK